MARIFEPYDGPVPGKGRTIILGIQHTFTMFGATVLVPMITGLNVSVALLMAGLCTLLFHVVTKGKVPIFLGSSFAFIAPILIVSETYGLEYALGGVVAAGFVYILVAVIVYFAGPRVIMSFFPPIVTGPVIMIIGLMLAPVAVNSASENWLLALASFLAVACCSLFAKGFLKMLPVLCGLAFGYLAAVIFGYADFAPVLNETRIVSLPQFTVARFNFAAIMIIVPVSVATMVEHIGDIAAINATCGKDFIKSPGLHRTLLGDGLASSLSAMFGGPANTTYSENTGVLALTRVFNPSVMRIGAVFAIFLGFVPRVAAVIATIPAPVIGGISIVLFGMIAAVGIRTLTENQADFKSPRNLIIAAVVLVLGLGGASLPINIGAAVFELQGVGLAAIVGIILNKILPVRRDSL